MSYVIPNPYRAAPPPAPALLRVAAHKKPGAALEIFEAAGPIDAAIKQVCDAGYPRAMVVVK